MKRVGQLFPAYATMEALLAAHQKARMGKRNHRACFEFERNLGANLQTLLQELQNGTYTPKPCNRFWVNENKKARLIEAPAYRDLVVQHAIYAAVSPIFERKYIHTNFACRIGKGTHKAADWLQAAMRKAPRSAWVLHVDVRKFFYSIDRAVLAGVLARHIKCSQTLALMAMFAQRPESTGVPIGNLLSQTFANVYLNSLDHFCKRSLKAQSYARYMDDSVMLAPSRQVGLGWLTAIRKHLALIGLEISHHSLSLIKRGVNFVGFRTWARARFVRPGLISAVRADAKNNRLHALVSRLGHAIKTASLQPLLNHLKANHAHIFVCLPQSHRRRYNPHPALA